MSASASTSTKTHVSGPSSSTAASPSLPHSPETQRQIAEARTALEASINNIGSTLDTSLRSRAQNLHANSAQLEKQQKEVVKATEGLRKEGEKLRKLADEGGRKVKELGNVQNWAEMLERDFLVLEETIRLAERGSHSGSEWETGSEGSWSGEEEPVVARSGERVDATGPPESALIPETVDADADTHMGDVAQEGQKRKGKRADLEEAQPPAVSESQQAVPESVSVARTGSSTDPSSSSAHTSTSAVSGATLDAPSSTAGSGR